MALTSASTKAEVNAAYEDNGAYDVHNSTSECQEFIHACRIKLGREPESVSSGGEAVTLSPTVIERRLDAAVAWLASHAAPSDMGRAGFTRARCL